jgi:hypothetical protein
LHEKDESAKASRQISRSKFFVVVLACSFAWYAVPGYLFPTLTSISWVCWVFSKSVTAQQLGSGMKGLGLGAFTLDWTAVASFLFSPLISPFFAIANVFFGYVFDHAYSILGVRPVQRQDIPYLLLALVHVKWHQLRRQINCEQSV